MLRSCVAALFIAAGLSGAARADFVIYAVPGLDIQFVLQGEARTNPGGTVSFRHALGDLAFSLESVEVKQVPTTRQAFSRMFGRAQSKKDVPGLFAAAEYALKHGLLADYYKAVVEVLKIDPRNTEALRIKDLKAAMNREIPENPTQEANLRGFVPKSGMRIALSKHFMLLYDTPEEGEDGRKPRHKARLDLLELVYESFLLTFFSRGVDLEVPQERMEVVLFNDYRDFRTFSDNLSPELSSAAGFWVHERNVSVFYDHGTDDVYQVLDALATEQKRIADDLRRQKPVPAGANEIIRYAKTLRLIVEIYRESHDIEVVSHEATHQLAGNTGLFPRHVRIPSWVHEGLAAYFEAPNDSTWAGIGAVNRRRLKWYRDLEGDREHSNIDFIVGDQIFDYAGNVESTLHGYGQAWALTHFLMEQHFDKLIAYYRRLGQLPPDLILSEEVLTEVFNEVFGPERSGLDLDWRSYMNDLKTDLEVALDEPDE